MKKKILFSLVLGILIIIIVSGFIYIKKSNTPEGIVSKVENYSNIKSKVRVILNGNEGDIDQECTLYYSKNFGKKLEIGQESFIVEKNGELNLIDNKTMNKFKLPKYKDNLYSLVFPCNILEMEISKVESTKIQGKNYIIVDINLPENNYNMNTATLCIDSASKEPVEIIIKDEKGERKGNIVYSDFETKETLDKSLFEF